MLFNLSFRWKKEIYVGRNRSIKLQFSLEGNFTLARATIVAPLDHVIECCLNRLHHRSVTFHGAQ